MKIETNRVLYIRKKEFSIDVNFINFWNLEIEHVHNVF